MRVNIEDSNLVITAKPKTIHFGLLKDVYKNLKYEIAFIIKHN